MTEQAQVFGASEVTVVEEASGVRDDRYRLPSGGRYSRTEAYVRGALTRQGSKRSASIARGCAWRSARKWTASSWRRGGPATERRRAMGKLPLH